MIKEKIILVPSCNENEVLRELAKHGVNTFNTRIMNVNDLIERMLLSKGIIYKNKVISNDESLNIVANLILKEGKCKQLNITNYEDCNKLLSSFNMYRNLITDNDENNKIKSLLNNNQKNLGLLDFYNEYKNKLNLYNLNDKIDYIRDGISLYTKNSNSGLVDIEFNCLEEFLITPLEEEVLKTVSNNNYNTISISDLYPKCDIEPKISFSSGYGITSEVKSIIDYIYQNKLSIDQCVIASTNYSTYSEQFLEYAREYNLNLSFANGIVITNTYPAALLKLLLNWKKNKYNYDSLVTLVNAPCFNKDLFINNLKCTLNNFNDILEIASGLRINNNDNVNKVDEYEKELENRIDFYKSLNNLDINDNKEIERLTNIKDNLVYVRNMINALNGNFSNIIRKYSTTRVGYFQKYDIASLEKITDKLDELYELLNDDDESNIQSILKEFICPKISSEEALHITTLKGALLVPRKHMFLCGLSSKYYPGKLKEDSFFYDTDLSVFGYKNNILNSINTFNNKKNELKYVIRLAKKNGCCIYLSYPSYDTKDYKNLNPTADLYDIYNDLYPNTSYNDYVKVFKKYDYSSNIEYLSKNDIALKLSKDNIIKNFDYFQNKYSPSAIKDYIDCPKKFFLSNIMYFNVDDDDDNNTIIASNSFGTILHEQMRLYMNNRFINEQDFILNSEQAFDLFTKGRLVGADEETNSEKARFINLIKNTIKLISNYNLISTEQVLNGIYKTKISFDDGSVRDFELKIGGRTDLICRDKNTGEVIIVDYKTGKDDKFKQNDPISCIQGLLYATIYSSKNSVGFDNTEANKCSFVFPKTNKIISCDNNINNINKIKSEVLDKMILSLYNQDFKAKPNNKDACLHCKYGLFCGK